MFPVQKEESMTRAEPGTFTQAQLAEAREALYRKRDELIGIVADLHEPSPSANRAISAISP